MYDVPSPSCLIPAAKHGEWEPPLPHLVPDPQAFITQGGALRSRPSPCYCRMNMLKSSGLKIPGRGPKHSSPVGRTSAGGTSSPVVPKDSKLLPPPDPVWRKKKEEFLSHSYFFSSPEVAFGPFICVNDSLEHSCNRLYEHGCCSVLV